MTSAAKNLATPDVTDTADTPVSFRPGRMEDRYAGALADLATTHNVTDAIVIDVAALQEALAASPQLAQVLSNPILPREAQSRALVALAVKLGAHKLTQNFLRLIAAKRRQSSLGIILTAFETEIARRSGIVTADVTSAVTLSAAQQAALTESLATVYNGAPINLRLTVDAKLLGGMTVRVGSRLFDRSLSGQLGRLGQTLQEAA